MQNLFAQRLVDPQFLAEKYDKWDKILANEELSNNLIQVLATFDKKTQILFYKNLADIMHKCDQL